MINWIQAGIGAVAGVGLCWLVHLVIIAGVERQHAQALLEQEDTLKKQCAADKAITKEVADDLQSKNDALSRRLSALKRVQPSACIVPTPGAAIGSNEAAGGAIATRAHGITTESLYDFAGEAESYRLRLIACQSFIEKTWQAKGAAK